MKRIVSTNTGNYVVHSLDIEKRAITYDSRLSLPLDFICKILGVTREDFATLSIANLLEEELDWIRHNNHNNNLQVDIEEAENHSMTVKTVKFEANLWVLKNE
jgi:ethanolamine utilization protein EutA (predicted chaperonin)